MDIQAEYRRKGARLSNGAVVLDTQGDYVLAHRTNEPFLPFAVWRFDATAPGAVVSGNYDADLADAKSTLAKRANREGEGAQ